MGNLDGAWQQLEEAVRWRVVDIADATVETDLVAAPGGTRLIVLHDLYLDPSSGVALTVKEGAETRLTLQASTAIALDLRPGQRLTPNTALKVVGSAAGTIKGFVRYSLEVG